MITRVRIETLYATYAAPRRTVPNVDSDQALDGLPCRFRPMFAGVANGVPKENRVFCSKEAAWFDPFVADAGTARQRLEVTLSARCAFGDDRRKILNGRRESVGGLQLLRGRPPSAQRRPMQNNR